MEIKLTNTECEELFFNALCNAVGTGYMNGYGLRFESSKQDYIEAIARLKAQGKLPALEEVWMEVLRGGKPLYFIDVEGGGSYTKKVTLQDVYERLPKTPVEHLMNMINEQDDVVDADVLLQHVFFGEVVFG